MTYDLYEVIVKDDIIISYEKIKGDTLVSVNNHFKKYNDYSLQYSSMLSIINDGILLAMETNEVCIYIVNIKHSKQKHILRQINLDKLLD